MKLLCGALRPLPLATRLVLCAILVLAATAALTTPAQADGIITHAEIIERAIEQLPDGDLADLLKRHPGVVKYGAMFPDWGMAVRGLKQGTVYDPLSEYAHDTAATTHAYLSTYFTGADLASYLDHYDGYAGPPAFRAALIAQLLSALRRNPRSEDEKAVAFLFGVIAHQEADAAWHVNTTNAVGYEPWAVDRINPKVDLPLVGLVELIPADMKPVAGSAIEAFIDVNLAHLADIATVEWYLPTAGVLAAYETITDTVTADMLAAGVVAQAEVAGALAGASEGIATAANPMAMVAELFVSEELAEVFRSGDWAANLYEEIFEGLYADVDTHRPGGLRDATERTIEVWQDTWDWMSTYTPVTTVTPTPATPDGNNGWYRGPVTVALSAAATDMFAEPLAGAEPLAISYTLDGGATQQPYTGPFTISTDKADVSVHSVDAKGIAEPPHKNGIPKIDMAPPVAEVEPGPYTRTEQFALHLKGHDPQPGSGIASVTGELNHERVVDGQMVDPFWFPLGNNDLAVRAEDVAGWVTETTGYIKMIATIESLEATVVRLCEESYITSGRLCKDLSGRLGAARRALERGSRNTAIAVLRARQDTIKSQAGKAILERAAALLLEDSAYVMKELKR